MVAKEGELPVLTNAQRRALGKIIDRIDMKLAARHENGVKRIRLTCGVKSQCPYEPWMDPVLIDTYKKEGRWKYVVVRHEPVGPDIFLSNTVRTPSDTEHAAEEKGAIRRIKVFGAAAILTLIIVGLIYNM